MKEYQKELKPGEELTLKREHGPSEIRYNVHSTNELWEYRTRKIDSLAIQKSLEECKNYYSNRINIKNINQINLLREETVKNRKPLAEDSLESDMLSLFDSDTPSIDTD